jgi:hypothetical protein
LTLNLFLTVAQSLPDGSTFKEKIMRTKSVLNWNEKLECWQAMYSGVKYMISARQLKAPETMAGSAAQASEWWAAKQAELERQLLERKCDEDQK